MEHLLCHEVKTDTFAEGGEGIKKKCHLFCQNDIGDILFRPSVSCHSAIGPAVPG
jgi:hypothetical protein